MRGGSKPKIIKFGKTYQELMDYSGRTYRAVVARLLRHPKAPMEDLLIKKKPSHYNTTNMWGVSTKYARDKYGIPQRTSRYYTVKKNMRKEELDQKFGTQNTKE